MRRNSDFKLNKWALLAIIVLAGSGCANLRGGDAEAGSIRPVEKTVHSVEESEAQYMLGKYYLGQNRTGLALSAFTQAVRRNPLNAEARNARAIALVKVGDFQAAITELETAVATSPNQAHLLNNLAYAYMLNGSLILAAENLQLSLQIEPGNPRARENWRELSAKASSNPRLAGQLVGKLPPMPAPETVSDKVPDTEPQVAPQSANPIDPPAPALVSAAVLNLDFALGLTPTPVFESPFIAPLAVDIREIGSPNDAAILLAEIASELNPVAPLALDVRALSTRDSRTSLLAKTDDYSPAAPLAVEVTYLPAPSENSPLLASIDQNLPIEPLAVEVLAQEPALHQHRERKTLASVYQPPYAIPGNIAMAVDVRDLSTRDNATLIAATSGYGFGLESVQFTQAMATDVLTRVAPADDLLTQTSIYDTPGMAPMAMDVRDMSSLPEQLALADTAIGSPIAQPVILTSELAALTAGSIALHKRERAPYVPGLALATGKSVFPHEDSDMTFDLSTVLVEVSNGNGVDRMAEVLGQALTRQKVRVWRITNAEQFDHKVTRIFYVDGHRNEAMALAAMLPGEAEIMPAKSALTSTQIRIVVGSNIATLQEANRVSAPKLAQLGPTV